MNFDQFRVHVLQPALKTADLWSPSAEILMLGTAWIESKLEHIKQIKGPALSFFQIEPKTHVDIKRYLKRPDNRRLQERVLSTCFMAVMPNDDALAWNMRYAALIARLKYWMIPKPLPAPDDLNGLAAYYKRYYNTSQGDSDALECREGFEYVVEAIKC